MGKQGFFIFCFGIIFSISSCDENPNIDQSVKPLQMDREFAISIVELPLKCLQKEYPNKLNQSLSSFDETGSPSALHPTFYGCFDWHSSVHGHWLLVNILRKFPDHPKAKEIIQILSENITKENILIELAYFKRESEKSFERPYGWAWLLKLHEELDKWDHDQADDLKNNLMPLSNYIVEKYMDFLPRLNYPVRSGEHSNTAFGLSLAYDYAVHFNNAELKGLIEERSKVFFLKDINCPMTWEPSGFDFLSPCLQEAELMGKILPKSEFKKWFDLFLPEFVNSKFVLIPAAVSDRTDGKLVHLDGANFCRAWSLYSVAKNIPEYHHLTTIANNHIDFSLPMIVDGSYEGEHWLASFAALSINN
jgi:hypothetical protein